MYARILNIDQNVLAFGAVLKQPPYMKAVDTKGEQKQSCNFSTCRRHRPNTMDSLENKNIASSVPLAIQFSPFSASLV